MPLSSTQMVEALRRWFGEMVEDIRVYFRRGWTIREMLSGIDLEPIVRRHLRMFYLVMLLVSACLAAGSYFRRIFGSSITVYVASAVFVCSYFVQHLKYVRFGFLILGSLFEGAFLTSSAASFTGVGESAVVISFVAILLIFGCLWISCMDPRIHSVDLCFYVTLARVFPVLLLWFASSPAIFDVDMTSWTAEVYLAFWRVEVFLVFYWVYMLVYSCEISLRARGRDEDSRGRDEDYVGHATNFVTALPGVIVHICFQMCIEVNDVFRREE